MTDDTERLKEMTKQAARIAVERDKWKKATQDAEKIIGHLEEKTKALQHQIEEARKDLSIVLRFTHDTGDENGPAENAAPDYNH